MAYAQGTYGPPPPGFNQGYPGQEFPGAQPYPPFGGAQQPGYPPYGQPYMQYPAPPPTAMPTSYNTYDHGAGGGGYSSYENGNGGRGLAFSDKTIRNAFIRKVYSILMVQLTITCSFIAFFIYHEPTKKFVQANPVLLLVALVITFVCLLSMACCESARRTTPTNYIFLLIFTLAESFMLGVISSKYHVNEVLLAAGICTVICFGLTIFAFQTKIDFTMCGGVLFVGVLILFLFGIILMFFHTSVGRLIYSCIGAFLFSVYLVYDTQLMIGGDHKYSISPEEYVFAALSLYIDIVNIFIYILSILGSSRD